jgi:hypothetical protein
MKRALLAFALVCLSAFSRRPEHDDRVTASGIRNGGVLVPLARVCFLGTDAQDRAINFEQGGGGVNGYKPYCAGDRRDRRRLPGPEPGEHFAHGHLLPHHHQGFEHAADLLRRRLRELLRRRLQPRRAHAGRLPRRHLHAADGIELERTVHHEWQLHVTGSCTGCTGLADVGTPGTYTKVTTDTKGRVTAGATAAAADLSNGVTGANEIVLKNSPTIVTPTIASHVNAGHDHSNAAGGGNISSTAVAAGNKEGNGTKFLMFTGADAATNNCAKFDVNHNIVDNGAACGSGGTGTVTHTPGALTLNQLVIGNAVDDEKVLGSLGTTTTVLHGNAAGAPSFAGVSLTADATANQGTTTTLLHGNAAGQPSFGAVVEGDQTLADVTTANVSITKHGYAPKAPNDATKYLDGTGAYSVPSAATSVGYTVQGTNTIGVSPADAATYYYGGDPSTVSIAGAAAYRRQRIYMPKACTLKTVFYEFYMVSAGSTELVNVYIRLNDTTDIANTTMTWNATNDTVSAAVTGLSQSIAAGDFIVFKILAPTWATNPGTTIPKGIVYCE